MKIPQVHLKICFLCQHTELPFCSLCCLSKFKQSCKAVSRSAVILYGVNVNANNLSLYNVTLRACLFVCVCETLD